MFINTEDLKTAFDTDQAYLESVAEAVLTDYYDEMPDFTLTFVEPESIRELNKTYRDVDSVTDVLSFESDGEYDPETGLEYLGDIVICLDQAQKQADKSGHSLKDEIGLLEIHGLLHLLGYDHEKSEEEEKEMFGKQEIVLEALGLGR